MNKKLINELAEKAYFLIENDKIFAPDGFDSINCELLYFAELIVKECAEVAADRDALDIYEEIREHFGVGVD
jgi:hypothetical protein